MDVRGWWLVSPGDDAARGPGISGFRSTRAVGGVCDSGARARMDLRRRRLVCAGDDTSGRRATGQVVVLLDFPGARLEIHDVYIDILDVHLEILDIHVGLHDVACETPVDEHEHGRWTSSRHDVEHPFRPRQSLGPGA